MDHAHRHDPDHAYDSAPPRASGSSIVPALLAVAGCLFLIVVAVAGVGVYAWGQFREQRSSAMEVQKQRALSARPPIDVTMDVAPGQEEEFEEEIREEIEEPAEEPPRRPLANPAGGDGEFEDVETDMELRQQLREAHELQAATRKLVRELQDETLEQHKRFKEMQATYAKKISELQTAIVLLTEQLKKSQAAAEPAAGADSNKDEKK